ncbi:MAG: shikimate kinase [Planctomycetota bacterium]|jgi:shikimate kinase
MPHIVLIGLRASGKTTLAHELSRALDLPSLDLDDRVRDALDAPTIQHVWKTLGEPAFREEEITQLRRALAEPESIIALGGGTPTATYAEAILREAQDEGAIEIYYLKAPPAVLRERLSASVGESDVQRPSLTGKGLLDEIVDVYNARDPLYCALADHIVDATLPLEALMQILINTRSD